MNRPHRTHRPVGLNTLWLLLAGVAAGAQQDFSPYFPNEQWRDAATGDFRPVAGVSRIEQEYKFALRGSGLDDPTNDSNRLAGIIRDDGLGPVLLSTVWQYISFMGGSFTLTTDTALRGTVDEYLDTPDGRNYLNNAGYRFQTRFSSLSSVDRWILGSTELIDRPQQLLFESRDSRRLISDGLHEVREGRFTFNLVNHPWNIEAYLSTMKSGLDTQSDPFRPIPIIRAAWNLVDFHQRQGIQNPLLSYEAFVVFEGDRTRLRLRWGREATQVFTISVDRMKVYDGKRYEAYMRSPGAEGKPPSVFGFSEVEVQIDSDAPLGTDPTRTQAGLEADRQTIMTIIRDAFVRVSERQRKSDYLRLFPEGRSKYAQGFDALCFIRGDVNRDGKLDISDPIALLNSKFLGIGSVDLRAADANSDGSTDISDAVYLLTFLFLDGPAPSTPFPLWGTGS
jgi:hypothetical protein